jgi:hypothetical protein
MLPLPPSSTIVIEFAKAPSGSNDLTASLYINDVEVEMTQCANAKSCAVATYQKNMASSVKLTNVTKSCEGKYTPPTETHKLRFD